MLYLFRILYQFCRHPITCNLFLSLLYPFPFFLSEFFFDHLLPRHFLLWEEYCHLSPHPFSLPITITNVNANANGNFPMYAFHAQTTPLPLFVVFLILPFYFLTTVLRICTRCSAGETDSVIMVHPRPILVQVREWNLQTNSLWSELSAG